jgi:DnaJ-class molecular chaperone
MSWEEGLMGTCPHCGLQVHAMYEDRATTNPVWTYCSTCAKAGVIAVRTSEIPDFWTQAHRCASCAGTLVAWQEEQCPRCKNAVKWTYILAAG